jgi:TetR/AcrR family transcriptional regulator, cholesterol catabolism regulator
MAKTWVRPSRQTEILDVFPRSVAADGCDNVSIRQIADYMGMSKGTVMHHYGSGLGHAARRRPWSIEELGESLCVLWWPALPSPTTQPAAVITPDVVTLVAMTIEEAHSSTDCAPTPVNG